MVRREEFFVSARFLRKLPLLCAETRKPSPLIDRTTAMTRTATLPTEVRRRVQKALRTRSFRAALHSNTGAIDLASIMVGIIVIGVIAGIIAATVFAVIPWSQDAAARQGLDAVRTAEGVAYAQDSRFSDFTALVSAQRIQASTNVNVVTDSAGSCYVAASRSAGGAVYYSTNTGPTVRPVTGLSTVTCVSDVVFAALVTEVGGAATPTPVSLSSFTAGGSQTFAQDSSGKLWAWGYNNYGQLGDGTTTSRSTPVAVNVGALGAATITSLVASTWKTFAKDSNGKWWAWGWNAFGQLGDGTSVNRSTPVAVNVGALGTATIASVVAGELHTVAQDSNGKAWAWGKNTEGELGDGTTVNRSTPVAVNMGALGTATIASVVAGGLHTVAQDSNGKYWAWGKNTEGELGDGTTVNRSTPAAVKVVALGTATIASVAAGYQHTVARDSNGKYWAWGKNTEGELGDGTTVNRSTPAAVNVGALGTAVIASVVAGDNYTIARDTTGKYWAWGINTEGELGDGTTINRSTPVTVNVGALGAATITSVVAGGQHTVALDSNGKYWAWGFNSQGELGDGTTISRSAPVESFILP